MPLPIAHGLLGASIVAAFLPEKVSVRYWKPLLLGAFLGNLPDSDFLLVQIFHSTEWHRSFTHSIFAAVCVTLFFVVWFGRNRLREAFGYGLAFASHCFLDFMTTREGGGLALFFPLTWKKYTLGWFGISEVPSRMTILELIGALGIEFAVFFSLLTLVLLIKRRPQSV